jgi:hypothetical protein
VKTDEEKKIAPEAAVTELMKKYVNKGEYPLDVWGSVWSRFIHC